MKAVTSGEIEFGLVERPEYHAEFRAGDGCLHIAGIKRIVADVARLVPIAAQSRDGAKPGVPLRRVLDVKAGAAFPHLVLARGRKRDTLERVGEADTDVVIAALKSECRRGLGVAEAALECVAGVKTEDRTAVGLAELVAIHRIVEEVREVVEQGEGAGDAIGLDPRCALVVGAAPAARKTVAARFAAVVRVERAVTADQVLIDRALGDLIGRIPAVGIGHGGER